MWLCHCVDRLYADEVHDRDIQVLKTYNSAPYADALKKLEKSIKEKQTSVNEKIGVKESDTGLAPPHLWDIAADRQRMSEEQPLQVARCTKIIPDEKDNEKSKYVINVKQIAKFVVNLGERVSPTDIEEGMRVGVDRNKYQIMLPLPPKIDPSVTMMTVEDKPDVTYGDVGGCKEQIEKLREVVEMPLLSPERFVSLGIDPPKGALLYGPPGTGKTLCARAVANRTDATFIRVIGSELVQKYVGEGARMVRELFEMARTKKACIIFFDEIDAVGGARFDDGAGGDNEVQRTMLELITQLDGFDSRGNIKVMFATNRPSTLDPALMRPGRIDRKIEFALPDMEGRANILRIHAKSMSVERDIRWELISRLCPNSTGAELRSVATEAGMFAIRARRKVASEKDFLAAVEKADRLEESVVETIANAALDHLNNLWHNGVWGRFISRRGSGAVLRQHGNRPWMSIADVTSLSQGIVKDCNVPSDHVTSIARADNSEQHRREKRDPPMRHRQLEERSPCADARGLSSRAYTRLSLCCRLVVPAGCRWTCTRQQAGGEIWEHLTSRCPAAPAEISDPFAARPRSESHRPRVSGRSEGFTNIEASGSYRCNRVALGQRFYVEATRRCLVSAYGRMSASIGELCIRHCPCPMTSAPWVRVNWVALTRRDMVIHLMQSQPSGTIRTYFKVD
nr:26s protease regulatory subunit 7 like [Quercus suber]